MEGGEEDDQGENGWMIHEVTGMKLAELRDVTAERKHWRRMVKTVAIELDELTARGDKVTSLGDSCF